MRQKLKIGYCYYQEGKQNYFHLISEKPDKLELPDNGSNVCPVVQDVIKNTFVVRSPYDICLKYKGDGMIDLIPEYSNLTDESFAYFIKIHPKGMWRNDKTPMIQILTWVIFVTDEKGLVMEEFPPFLEYRPDFPCVMTASKFNIYNWTRPIGIIYEWMDTTKPIVIKRGDPLVYIRFNTDKNVKLEFIKDSEKIVKMAVQNSGLKMHIKYFSREAMKLAGRIRPRKLL